MSEEIELEARVDLCTDFSFERCMGLTSALVSYQREGPYTVVAVLPDGLVRDIDAAFEAKGADVDFSAFGHLCIPISYLQGQGIEFCYTDSERFPAVLASVRKEMVSTGVGSLYNICLKSDSDRVVGELREQKYDVTVIQR